MSQAIAEILRQRIAELAIVGKSAGLVRAITRNVGGKNKTFPVACTVQDPLACSESTVVDLIPDSRYDSIVYFEDLGSSTVPYPAERLMGTKYRVRLRLVGWMDTRKIGELCTTGDQFVREIQEAVTVLKPYNLDPFKGITHKVVNVQPKAAAIFGKYTYDEANRLYLNWPYDYFAIDIETVYILPPGCEEPIVPSDQGCITEGGPVIGGPGQSGCKLVRVCGTPEDGEVPVWDEESGTWKPEPQSGGTGIQSIVAGANIQVDDTDPLNPIVSASAAGAPLWGAIGGTLSDQTDLQDALDLKANTADLGSAATKDTSIGGNAGADAGKLLEFNTGGQIQGSSTNESLAAVTGDTQGGTGVRGYAQGGTAGEFLGNTGHGLIANSSTGIGAEVSNNSTTQPALHVRNFNAADLAPLAHFEAQDGLGMQVLNNGALDWTSANGPLDTRTNLGLGTAALANTGDFDAAGSAATAESNANAYTDAGLATKEDAFSKGSIVAGTGISTSGALSNRLVGSGSLTIGVDATLAEILVNGFLTGAQSITFSAGTSAAMMADAGGGGTLLSGPVSTGSAFTARLQAASGTIAYLTDIPSTPSWKQVLTSGNVTDGLIPTVSNGDYIQFNGTGAGTLRLTGALTGGSSFVSTLPNNTGTLLSTGATVTVPQGGTGATTLTGLVKGNGTSAFTAAVAGTDYLTPTGNGSGLTALNASNLSSGTVPGARMPALTGDVTMTAGTTTTAITAGVIVDADVNASAAIAVSKLGQSGAATGDLLQWNGSAWVPYTNTIGTRVSIPAYSSGNQPNSTTTSANAAGSTLAIPSAGVWQVEYRVVYTTAAGTTGAQFSINYSGTATLSGFTTYSALAADGSTSNITGNDGGLAVASSRVAGAGNTAVILVRVYATTTGDVQLSWQSEVGGSAITITNIAVGEAIKIAN